MQKELQEIEFGNYYIPFATHISKRTVISKSGLISQTVLVQSSKDINISQNIINALQTILTPDVFVNIHTIHSENVSTKPESFVHFLLKSYSHTVAQHNQYTQNFYITISTYGHKIDLKNFGHFMLRKRFLMDIETAILNLEALVQNFCKKIEAYSPHILTIKSRKDVLYSENAGFLYNILYGSPASIPVADVEISTQVKPVTINHGKNYLQFIRKKNIEFIAVLTVKEFPIAEKRKMAELFTINSQYIIAQSFYQMESKDIQPFFAYQHKTTSIVRDNNIIKQTGWGEMLKTNQPICMQTNFIIHANTKDEMEKIVAKVVKKLQESGLVAVREDVNCEQAFYASLPANPHFINRKDYNLLKNAGQFISAPDFLFQGVEKIKYLNFFPILDNENKLFGISPFLKTGTKHILVNGSNLQGKFLLLNTMLLHLYKSSRILCVDTNYSSFALIKTIDGSCISHPTFNILNLLEHSQKSFFIVFSSAVRLYCVMNNVNFSQELTSEIEAFTKKAKSGMKLEELQEICQSDTLKKTLEYISSHNLLAEKDSVRVHKNYMAINLGDNYDESYQIVCLYIMLNSIHTGQEGDILKIDHTFDMFTENVISQGTMLFILKEASAKGIAFILGNDVSQNFEAQNITKYGDVFITFEFAIFTESECSTQFVKKFFQVKSNVVKHLMFAKKGTNKAVINTPNYLFTINLSNFTKNKKLEVLDFTHQKYIENIKTIDSYKEKKDELLELFLQKYV